MVINPVFAQRESMLLCGFLAVKIGPWMRLTSTIELSRPGRKTIPCEYQSKPVANVGTAEPSIKNPLYCSIPPCYLLTDF
jgi:hypothetical protein